MRVLIAAGGTAGHINPALAIAGALKKRHPDAEIHFAGRQKGMEYGLVSKAGYAFHPIEVNGIQRRLTPKNIARNLVALWHLALSGPRAGAILREVKPDLVIGAGGYVSGPVVQAAARRGIRTAIHEQNAFPGVTNKILAKQVDLVFAAMPDAVQRLGAPDKTVVTGNPVREEMFRQDRPAARRALGAKEGQAVIISFGGSLGAQVLGERGRFGKMGDRAA
ncbi:MAG: UDP-N-acetylglucosamine--N-acetylmuramyl-(pentapeptide) pyrophosphoryl-undecaprenol N-acetylglucosamine transferase [Ruthenibacterium lactatiformans]